MVKKRSKQNNPEQKTRNGANNQDVEFGRDFDPVKQSKKNYEKSGGQPVKSKFHPEPEQSS
ncbi:glycogen biosynthesis protein GlgD [Cytobacillus firmus]